MKQHNNLSKSMQERLDKWRKNTIPVTSAQKVRQHNFVSRGDYGDDIRDYPTGKYDASRANGDDVA